MSVTVPTKVRRCTPGHRHSAHHAVTSPTTLAISPVIHDEAINGKRTTVNMRVARLQAARTANSALLALYWQVGRLILSRQENEPWGSGSIKRLAGDLRHEFPDMKGLSPTNLQYMRASPRRGRTQFPNAALGIAVGASLHPAGSGQGACADWYADRDTRNGTGVSSISFRVPPEHSGPRRPGQSATGQGRRRGS